MIVGGSIFPSAVIRNAGNDEDGSGWDGESQDKQQRQRRRANIQPEVAPVKLRRAVKNFAEIQRP